jgi:hypothetical protein
MRTFMVVLVLFALGFSSTVYAECAGDKSACERHWTLASLTKHHSLHDGPNCFNAALVAAGLMDQLTYVDSMEYGLYTEFFCQLQTKNKWASGNLLVYMGIKPSELIAEDPAIQILHGALILGHGKIFEKTSINGSLFNKPKGRERPGLYQIKNASQSAFATKSSGVKMVNSYRCSPPAVTQKKIEKWHEDQLAKHISEVRTWFNQQIKTESISNIKGIKEKVDQITAALAERNGSDFIDFYINSTARSLSGTIESIMSENEKNYDHELNESLEELNSVNYILTEKIRAHSNDERILRVLSTY